MAAVLKVPGASGKGVVTFTTQERDRFILPDPAVRARVEALKDKWAVCLHHNWHDWSFRCDPLFDASFAGAEDLREVDGREVPLIPMTASNFVPPCFRPGGGEKFWDVLSVSRAVYFKRIPEFFQAARRLYDAGHKTRILHLCTMPERRPGDEKVVFHDIRARFEELFTPEERKRFTLLVLDFDTPFPLDLETLAHFYRSSRVFVHTASDERRCRVATYAWACGLPLVGMDCVGSVLPASWRTPPVFYRAAEDADFDRLIPQAVAAASLPSEERAKAARHFAISHASAELVGHLRALFARRGWAWEETPLFLGQLDLRLARHHGVANGDNGLRPTVAEFCSFLETAVPGELAQGDPDDPERAWQARWPAPPAASSSFPRWLRRLAGRS